MIFDARQKGYLLRLIKSWPPELKFDPEDTSEWSTLQNHPLNKEVKALTRKKRSSLPFFTSNRILWITTAEDTEDLLSAVEDLRAWVIPGFGWEHKTEPFITSNRDGNRQSGLILALSPDGYFRWWSRRGEFENIVGKLRKLRFIEEKEPFYPIEFDQSLYELRQQFDSALLIGDRQAALDTIDKINRRQLDSATNTQFMEISLWNRFREYEVIVNHPNISEIIQLRMPHSIRLSIARAFYTYFISPVESDCDLEEAKRIYEDKVHSALAGLLDACRPQDDIEVAHLIAYKAALTNDSKIISQFSQETSNTVVTRLLSQVVKEKKVPKQNLEDKFYEAARINDWREVQETGLGILRSRTHSPEIISDSFLKSTLIFSLNILPNPLLVDRLRELGLLEDESAVEQLFEKEDTITTKESSAKIIAPQTWRQFFKSLRNKDWKSGEMFINLEERPNIADQSIEEISFLLESMEDLMTDPEIAQDSISLQVLTNSLSLIIRDFVIDNNYPSSIYMEFYKRLLILWSECKRGSATPVDANLLLELAEVVLANDISSEKKVAEVISEWWMKRKVRALLPFLLSAVDIMSELMTDLSYCETLWIDGADFIRNQPQLISVTERQLWRQIGKRVGLNDEIIEEFLGESDKPEEQEIDPLEELELKKIAIVSLREESAQVAAKLIKERTNANIILVNDKKSGAKTDSAKTADVILFIWSSTTHAVFRAFDSVKDKIAYVQGTGASSIVIALENWALRQT